MTPDQRQNPKLLWGISTGLVLIVAAGLAASQWLASDSEPAQPAAELHQPVAKPAPVPAVSETPAASEPATVLVQESILQDPVTDNPVLAEEEVAKLNDIQTQLIEQEQTLQAQHADADELIKLKEEQIKLLEAQLAAQ